MTDSQRANYNGGKKKEMDYSRNQMEHDYMLMGIDRVHVLGQWVDRPVSEHHWEIMLTIIQCAVFEAACGFPLNAEMIECT